VGRLTKKKEDSLGGSVNCKFRKKGGRDSRNLPGPDGAPKRPEGRGKDFNAFSRKGCFNSGRGGGSAENEDKHMKQD